MFVVFFVDFFFPGFLTLRPLKSMELLIPCKENKNSKGREQRRDHHYSFGGRMHMFFDLHLSKSISAEQKHITSKWVWFTPTKFKHQQHTN